MFTKKQRSCHLSSFNQEILPLLNFMAKKDNLHLIQSSTVQLVTTDLSSCLALDVICCCFHSPLRFDLRFHQDGCKEWLWTPLPLLPAQNTLTLTILRSESEITFISPFIYVWCRYWLKLLACICMILIITYYSTQLYNGKTFCQKYTVYAFV